MAAFRAGAAVYHVTLDKLLASFMPQFVQLLGGGAVRGRRTLLKGTSSLQSLKNNLTVLAWSPSHLRCQCKSVKATRIQSMWIGTLKNNFMVDTFISIWN
ncbi:uncharacterized protein LOC100453736 [Pongo abelii]|uniref:uncharacterized protein LOC100453736 n=1 Tax=Pongo abelii TaxID=9601 RepID=UPI0023E8C917|nr:uncharacterized protein LOC100453736 [Pongo abelii]XP_054384193.1 uncharacterized protein LOC100453736 [Pongo abelii]